MTDGAAALEVTQVSYAYSAGRPVLRSVDLDARPGEVTMILGMSGSGKTTLLKLCKGLLEARTGSIRVLGWMPDAERARSLELLGRLGIRPKADEKVFALSGGERQRVAIARALMQAPDVLLADEFISDLDPVTTETIMAVIREIADTGVAVVMTTHEMDVVREHAGHVVVLRDGAKVMDARTRPDLEQIVAAFR